MRHRLILPVALSALLAIAVMGGVYYLFHAEGKHTRGGIIKIARGETLHDVAPRLEALGMVRAPFVMRLGAYLFDPRQGRVQAGEYRVPAHARMSEMLLLFRSGRVVQHPITIPEGLSVAEIAELIRTQPVLAGALDALPPEGSLLPETYHVARGVGRSELLSRMQKAQQALLAALWPSRAPDLPLASPEEAVILASIVEKETHKAAERPQVAGVFINRLRRGMRLQADPTVIYALTGGLPLPRALTRKDLRFDSPYNTYRVSGLPPTPIANPGRASLEAVLAPLETDALYFVADGAGGHAFADTLKAHNENVARLRKILAARKEKAEKEEEGAQPQ